MTLDPRGRRITDPRSRWKWSASVNMGYLQVGEKRDVVYTQTLVGGGADRIMVDYDEDGNVVGVEVFG